jgi:hypothetical protein
MVCASANFWTSILVREAPSPLFSVTADSKALISLVLVTAESKGLAVPKFEVYVTKFGSADYKGLTALGRIRRITTADGNTILRRSLCTGGDYLSRNIYKYNHMWKIATGRTQYDYATSTGPH